MSTPGQENSSTPAGNGSGFSTAATDKAGSGSGTTEAATGGNGFFGGLKLGYGTASVLDLPQGTETGYGFRLGNWARGLGIADVPLLGDLYQMGKGIGTGDANMYFAGSFGLGINLLLPGRGKVATEAAESFAGVKAASLYLQEIGLPRAQRVQILQSFEAGTVGLRGAGPAEYGLRFFDGKNAQASGRYLFETFPASRESLALPPGWNQMTGITQWQIRPGATLIEGRAAAQGAGLPGGQMQKFVPNLGDLLRP